MKGLLSICILGISPFFLNGCGNEALSSAGLNILKLESANVWLEGIQFKVLSDINEDSPVIVDLVIAYTQDLYDQLITLTSAQYFAGKLQFQKDFPQDIEIYSWEAVPGQPIAPKTIRPQKTNGKGALVFIRYQTPGLHRAQVGDARVIEIKLERQDFELKKIR